MSEDSNSMNSTVEEVSSSSSSGAMAIEESDSSSSSHSHPTTDQVENSDNGSSSAVPATDESAMENDNAVVDSSVAEAEVSGVVSGIAGSLRSRKRTIAFDELKSAVDDFVKAHTEDNLKMKALMNHLKNQFGKKVRKQKEQIRSYLSSLGYGAKADGDAEGEAEAEAEVEAEGDVEQEANAAEGEEDGTSAGTTEESGSVDDGAAMDEEAAEDDEEEKVSKKGNKRNRDDEDEDYEESSSKKKSKKSKKSSVSASASDSSSSSSNTSSASPKPPKAALRAYDIFMVHEKKRLKLNPSGEKVDQKLIQKRISTAWKELPRAEKAKFDQLQKEDEIRYEKEMNEFALNHPAEAAKVKEKKPKKKRKSKRGEAKYDDEEPAEEEKNKEKGEGTGRGRAKKELDEIEAALLAARPRRQRKSEYSDGERKEIANLFIDRMRQAAQDDHAKAKRGEPALEKLKLLPILENEVQKKEVQDLIRDRIVTVLREWLEPVGTEKLPNIRLRTAIYKMLDKLPVGETELDQSMIGHLLLENLDSAYETMENKTFLVKLIEKFMHKILSEGSNSYRKINELLEKDVDNLLAVQKRRQLMAARADAPGAKNQFSRALIPQRTTFDFAVRPRNMLTRQAEEDDDEEGGADQAMETAERKEVSKRETLMKRLEKQNRSASTIKKATTKVDIQGRRLPI